MKIGFLSGTLNPLVHVLRGSGLDSEICKNSSTLTLGIYSLDLWH